MKFIKYLLKELFNREVLSAGISIEGDDVVFIRVRAAKNGPAWESCAGLSLAPFKDEEGKARALAEFVRNQGAPKFPAAALPYSMTLARTIRLPSVDMGEISSMVDLQAARLMPLPADEILSAFHVLEFRDDGYADVLMMVSRRDEVEKALSLFEKAGIVVSRAVPGAFAGFSVLAEAAGPRPAVLLDVDARRAAAAIVDVKKIKSMRPFASPGDFEKCAADVRDFIETYEKSNPVWKPEILYAAGHIAEKSSLLSALAGTLDFPVEWREILPRPPHLNLSSSVLPAAGAARLVEGPDMRSSIDQRKSRRMEAAGEKRRFMVWAAILSAAIAATIFLKSSRVSAKTAHLRRELAVIEPRAKEIKKLLDKIQSARREEMGSPSEALGAVQSALPPRATLTSLSYERGTSVSLQGTASTLGDVFSFSEKLGRNPIFKRVEIRSSNLRSTPHGESAEFFISMEMGDGRNNRGPD